MDFFTKHNFPDEISLILETENTLENINREFLEENYTSYSQTLKHPVYFLLDKIKDFPLKLKTKSHDLIGCGIYFPPYIYRDRNIFFEKDLFNFLSINIDLSKKLIENDGFFFILTDNGYIASKANESGSGNEGKYHFNLNKIIALINNSLLRINIKNIVQAIENNRGLFTDFLIKQHCDNYITSNFLDNIREVNAKILRGKSIPENTLKKIHEIIIEYPFREKFTNDKVNFYQYILSKYENK